MYLITGLLDAVPMILNLPYSKPTRCESKVLKLNLLEAANNEHQRKRANK